MASLEAAQGRAAGGPIRHLAGFPATVALRAPGRLGSEDAAEALIFDAGVSIHRFDLMARFWAEDAASLDWLDDFLLNPETDDMVREREYEEEEEVEDVIHFSKADLTTLGSEFIP